MSKYIHTNVHKNRNNTFVLIFTLAVFASVCAYYVNIDAESVSKDGEVEDLTIYDMSSGFYEVPMSTSIISSSEKTIDNPTMALTDTLILKDDSNESQGVSMYKLSSGLGVVHAEVGNGHESSYAVSAFGVGDFTIIKTRTAFACSELTLSQCESNPEYISEKMLSITYDGLPKADTTLKTNASSTATTTSKSLDDVPDSIIGDGILVLASSTKPTATTTEPVLILDTINPAGSSLILPSDDNTPQINLEAIYKNTAPVESSTSVNNDYTNNQEVKNADF